MRSTIPATLLALGCFFIYSAHSTGCATNNTPDVTSSSGTSTGGSGGAAGAGGGGEGGGPICTPKEEICDGKDNDCDGDVDEGCPCVDGQTQSCYSGPDGTAGVGPCSPGQQTCDSTGTWGPCVGEVKPKLKETCNTVDDDCNGAADDMGNTVCGVGACQVTVLTCENGMLNPCVPLAPTLEVCDGLDNNCNLQVDETFPDNGKACSVPGGIGPCATGKKSCVSGAETCVPTVTPAAFETCNGLDDNCNGQVDEDIPGTGFDCGTGYLGICSIGQLQCLGGKIDCFPVTPASAEKCNGVDDDCDGTIDEDNPGGNIICDTGKPDLCSAGTTNCAMGVLQCVPNLSNEAEKCNGVDDNCNGQIDEGNPGGGVACGCGGMRACMNGKIVCQGGPTVYLEEDFSDPVGWSLDPEWDITAPPVMVTCNDPLQDTSPSMDNRLAGVKIGGCALTSLHAYYFLTSPAFDTSKAPAVILSFQRWLNTDYAPYMDSVVQVYNGATWYTVWHNGASPVTDQSWTKVSYDISTYKNANMRIRWGFNVGSSGATPSGSWNIDDVQVIAATCP